MCGIWSNVDTSAGDFARRNQAGRPKITACQSAAENDVREACRQCDRGDGALKCNRVVSCFVVWLGLQFGLPGAWAQSGPSPTKESPVPAQGELDPAEPPPKPVGDQPEQREADAIARQLVAELASDQFAVRERATAKLIMLGLPGIAHLERASRSDNREVRQRSQLVLSVVHELDFQNRLESFENSTEGEGSYGLPGWERFRELVGRTANSRPLFAAMQRAERELMAAEQLTGDEAANVLARHCQRLRFSVQIFGAKHELSQIAAALFVATNQEIPLHKSTHTSLMSLCQQGAFENAMGSETHGGMMRKMLAAWILRNDAVPANELLLMALQHNIPESLPRARALAKRPVEADRYDRYFAVLCLARFGELADVAILEPIMADKTVVSSYRLNNLTYKIQVRDVVLAAMLALTKSDPAEFGYGRLRIQEPVVFDGQTLGFANDEDRQLAIAKWQEYRLRPKDE